MDASKSVSIQEFLSSKGTIIDLRTPLEFEKGHIPSAMNVPLFSDAERKEVGKVFKFQGPFKAMELGLKYVGPKLSEVIARLGQNKNLPLKIYCGRGGMRSQSMVWLLNFCRLKVCSLQGGYKSYRRFVLDLFHHDFEWRCLQPFIGCLLDPIAHQLGQKHQFLDIESLANFKMEHPFEVLPAQPSTEHFENLIADKLLSLDPRQPIWVRYVSKQLGACKIPGALSKQFKTSALYLLQKERFLREQQLTEKIQNLHPPTLKSQILLFKKKLGSFKSKQLIEALENHQEGFIAKMLVDYFDKILHFHLKKHKGSIQPFV